MPSARVNFLGRVPALVLYVSNKMILFISSPCYSGSRIRIPQRLYRGSRRRNYSQRVFIKKNHPRKSGARHQWSPLRDPQPPRPCPTCLTSSNTNRYVWGEKRDIFCRDVIDILFFKLNLIAILFPIYQFDLIRFFTLCLSHMPE